MYIVKYGERYLHDPKTPDCILNDLSLDCEENSCGFCEFTMYPTHPLYDTLREHNCEITVYEDDELLFTGFIYELGKNFQLEYNVKCKGVLGYLSESIVRPYGVPGGDRTYTDIREYFTWLINNHNSQVDESRQFRIGKIESYNFDVERFYPSNKSYSNTWDEINERLIGENGIGGYVRVRDEGVRYIDYIYDYSDVNTQILDFGVNLTDYTHTDDSLELATFIIPTGNRTSDTGYEHYENTKYGPYYGIIPTNDREPVPDKSYYILKYVREDFTTEDSAGYNMWPMYENCGRLTEFESGVTYYEYDVYQSTADSALTIRGISGYEFDNTRKKYPNGDDFAMKDDMVYSISAVAKYGWIGYTHSNTAINTRAGLVSEAISALNDRIEPRRTITINAIDMHLLNPDIRPIRIGEFIRVRSKPHNIDSYFLCRGIELDLNKPDNSKYTLGCLPDTYTDSQKKTINILNSSVTNQFETTNKPVSKIDAKKTNDKIDAVTLTYEDGTTNTYKYSFNEEGDVTKFGDIPIVWS